MQFCFFDVCPYKMRRIRLKLSHKIDLEVLDVTFVTHFRPKWGNIAKSLSDRSIARSRDRSDRSRAAVLFEKVPCRDVRYSRQSGESEGAKHFSFSFSISTN